MKSLLLLPLLAASATAIVVPDEQIEARLVRAAQEPQTPLSTKQWPVGQSAEAKSSSKKHRCGKGSKIDKLFGRLLAETEQMPSYLGSEIETSLSDFEEEQHRFNIEAWLSSGDEEMEVFERDLFIGSTSAASWEPPRGWPRLPHMPNMPHPPAPPRGPHPPPPPPGKGKRPHHPPGKRPPHHRDPHHHFPTRNYTIYELLTKSNRTKELAKFISNYTDIVDILNSTKSNHTFFVPPQHVLKHVPKNISDSIVEKALSYHIAEGSYYPPRLFYSHTIPTAFNSSYLGGHLQRLRVGLGLHGFNLNFRSIVSHFHIPAKNGVIYGLNHVLFPPPPSWLIVKLFPQAFSQLQLALVTTGIEDKAKNATKSGGTFFAPTNSAFSKLGPRLNAFLFSERGKPYLRKLLEYHYVANQTLYSDAYYGSKETVENLPQRGYFHVDLPSTLGKPIAVDVKYWGRLISITLNGFTRVSVIDGVAADGVVHVIPSVLIPPHPHKKLSTEDGNEISIEDFKSLFTVEAEDDAAPTVDEEQRIEL